MTAAVEIAKEFHKHFPPGTAFTNAQLYAAYPNMHWKTVANRIKDQLVVEGLCRWKKAGHYVSQAMPPIELEAAINRMGNPGYYRRLNIGGTRPKPKAYNTRVRKINEQWREPLFKEQNGICALCGFWMVHPIQTAVDHNVPLVGGGPDTPANLVLMHYGCNAAKSKMTHTEAQDHLESIGHPMCRDHAYEAFNLGIEFDATCTRDWYDD